jgi:hypothetical protein
MNIKSILYLLFIGTEKNVPKYNLHKRQDKEDILLKINRIIEMNFYTIALAVIILLFLVFIWACFTIVGLSATDSGLTYNAMERII